MTTLGDEIAAALPMLREMAESLMLDTCRVDEITGSTVDANGAETPTYTQRYSGKAKVQTGATEALTPEAGGATFTVQRSAIHFPVGSFVPKVGLVVTVTAAVLDSNLVGCKFRVTALLHKSMPTAYRLGVEEIVS